jgi:hypothetical protein
MRESFAQGADVSERETEAARFQFRVTAAAQRHKTRQIDSSTRCRAACPVFDPANV